MAAHSGAAGGGDGGGGGGATPLFLAFYMLNGMILKCCNLLRLKTLNEMLQEVTEGQQYLSEEKNPGGI